jgi:hypothetical protein
MTSATRSATASYRSCPHDDARRADATAFLTFATESAEAIGANDTDAQIDAITTAADAIDGGRRRCIGDDLGFSR